MNKLRLLLTVSLILSRLVLSGQTINSEGHQGYLVTYDRYKNGSVSGRMELEYADQAMYLPGSRTQYLFDFQNKKKVTVVNHEGQRYKLETPFRSLMRPRSGEERDTILGYSCRKASFHVGSALIELWYTEDSRIKGTPYHDYLPSAQAFVLKAEINRQLTLLAASICPTEENRIPHRIFDEAEGITAAEYEEIKIKSRYTTLNVFKDETINYSKDFERPLLTEIGDGETHSLAHGTVILKRVELPSMTNRRSTVFADLTCRSNGDLYDRTGSVFIIPDNGYELSMLDAFLQGLEKLPACTTRSGLESKGFLLSGDYMPAVEVMRFYTSFGVSYFNSSMEINNYEWEDGAIYKQDITSLFPADQDEIWIGVYIGNFDRGGHKVDLNLHFYPYSPEDPHQKYIRTLFNTVPLLEAGGQGPANWFHRDTLRVEFEVPGGLDNLQLHFTSTGHGGWEQGDEFTQRLNRLLVDGKQVFSIVPWRTDCGTYRMYNPASANFRNGMSSSDISRSNWCPGTLTPPYVIELSHLEPGMHTLDLVIDQGKNEGNSWNVSGILTGRKYLE